MLLAIRNGAIKSAGMLAAIKNVWRGASTLALVPAPATPIPMSAENRLPAQVGHPTKRPQVAPSPPAIDVLACRDLFNLYANTLSATLKPTSTDTIAAKITFIGIINNKKCSVM